MVNNVYTKFHSTGPVCQWLKVIFNIKIAQKEWSHNWDEAQEIW